MMSKSLILCLLLLAVNNVFCQLDSLDREFGQVSIEDLKMERYDKDTSANALILLDKGKIGYDGGRGLIYMDYHAQIKIFNRDAFYLADFTLPYTISKGTKIEANTYQLVDGSVKKSVVTEVIQDKLSDELYTKQITFPGVVEGVVIEYKYRVFSNSLADFLPWYFQSFLPVRYSEFKVNIPGAFRLKPRLYGYKELDVYQDKASDAWHDMRMVHVPAFREEPYIKKIDDHFSKITFEYESFFADSWEDLNKLILSVKGFGETFKRLRTIKRFLPFKEDLKQNEESLKRIHSIVSNHFKWNGLYTLSFSDKPKKVWNSKVGASADINLLLLMFLRSADITAHPVFLSTVENGVVNPDYVTYSQFNALAVYAKIEDKEYLLDATSSLRPFNVIPDGYLNGKGLVVREDSALWVPMHLNKEIEIQTLTTDLTLDLEEEIINGNARISSVGALAANTRIVFNDNDTTDFRETVKEMYTDVDLDSISITGLDDAYSNVQVRFNYEAEDHLEAVGQRFYFSPVVFKEMEQNPFKLQERTLPIDFITPIRDKYIFNITIPDGYEIEEMPKQEKYLIDNGGGEYVYQIEKTSQGLRLLIRFNINRVFFAPHEYPSIREMFNLIISKQEEKVVLVRSK